MPDVTPEDPEFFAGLVAQVADCAIISLDPQGLITSWNTGAERVKQYTAAEALGRSFTTFYTDHDRRAGLPMQLLEQARLHGHVEHTGWRRRKDGTLFWGDVVITALRDAEGRHQGFAKVTRDLTDQHELETRLRESEERLRLLVGQVADYAIIALDPQGTIETWNLGAERLKGYREHEALGMSFANFYTAEDRRAGVPARLLESARRDGRVQHAGWRVRRDGTRFWGDVVITALHDDAGTLTGYAKVTRDRTDLKRLEEAQDAFYAAFRHDFRAPLSSLQGFVQLLRDAEEEDRDRLVDRIESSADRLMTMVEGLVEFATTRAAAAQLRLDTIDVAQVVRDVVAADLGPELRPRRVVVTADVALAVANGEALHRVLTNLLVNALKYSDPESPVHVTVALASRPRDAAQGGGPDVGPDAAPARGVEIRVQDRGRGIDPDDLQRIFEEFERGRLAEADGGTGLGLASVKRLVEQQHGAVRLESELGRGTTAVVWLPREQPVPDGRGTGRAGQSSAAGEATAGQPSG